VNSLNGTQITITVDITLQASIGNGSISVNNSGVFAFANFVVNGPYYMVVQTDSGQTVLCDLCTTTVERQVVYQILNFDRSTAAGVQVCEVVTASNYTCAVPATFPGLNITACTAPLTLLADGLLEDDWSLRSDGFSPVGCGYTDADTWQWAGSAASFPQVLGRLNGTVNTNQVTINGTNSTTTPATLVPGTVISH